MSLPAGWQPPSKPALGLAMGLVGRMKMWACYMESAARTQLGCIEHVCVASASAAAAA